MDEELNELATSIVDSSSFMWLMAGSNHVEFHLDCLREAYWRYKEIGGGYAKGYLYDPAAGKIQ